MRLTSRPRAHSNVSASKHSSERPPTHTLTIQAQDVAARIRSLEDSIRLAEAQVARCRQDVTEAKAIGADPGRHARALEAAEHRLQALQQEHQTAMALQAGVVEIQRGFDDYARALERNDEHEDRLVLHQNHAQACRTLDNWNAAWSRLVEGGHRLPDVQGDVCPADSLAQDTSQQPTATSRDFFKEPFPADAAGQIEHVVGMQAQLRELENHLQTVQKRCDQLKVQHARSPEQERDAIKSDYAASLSALMDGKAGLSALNKAYFETIGANLDRLHFDAFDELHPVALVMQEIRTSTTEQSTEGAVAKYLDDMKRLKSQLMLHGAQLEPHQRKFDVHATMVQIVFLAHMSYIEALQAIVKCQEAFPPEARLPLRCPWDNTPKAQIKRSAEVLMEKSKDRPTQNDVNTMTRQQLRFAEIVQKRSVSIGKRLQHTEVGFDRIVAELVQIQRRRDKDELTRYALALIAKVQQKRWLLTAADTVVELFKRIAAAFQSIEKQPGPGETGGEREPQSVRRVRTERKIPRREHKVPDAKAHNRPDASLVATQPRTPHRHRVSGAAAAPDLPMTTEMRPEDQLATDWRTAGAPAAWTQYVSLRDGVETTLRATNRTLESRASNIRNWNQHDMAGNQSQPLTEEDCLALIDWAAWSSRAELPDDEKLFTHFTMLCSPGTGNFAGQLQLKIVNTDPDVPAVVTNEFDQMQRKMKRPTFHLRVDLDAQAFGRVRQALAVRGFPPANE